MTVIRDTIFIEASPENVYTWFLTIHDNYLNWHHDHVMCKWIEGRPFEVGSVLYMEEYIHGELHKFKLKTTKIIENQEIEYKFSFPTSLFISFGTFIFESSNSGCLFTAEMNFRFGWILKNLMRGRFQSLIKHMNEEGQNLKSILQNENLGVLQ